MSSAVVNLTAEDQNLTAEDQGAGPDHGPASAGTRASAAARPAAVPGRKPGRPRSEKAEQAIIQAALELFAEKGPDGLCVEAVAARAGVGKATVYRRWKNKEDLLLAALGSLKSPLPDPDTGSVRDDLIAMVTVMAQDGVDPARQRQYTLLLGEGAKYPKLMTRYAETVVEPRRETIRAVLRRGIATGQLRADIDVEIVLLTLTGAAMSRGRCEIVPHDAEFATRVVDSLLTGLTPR